MVLAVRESGVLKSGVIFAVLVEDLPHGTAVGFDLYVRTRDGHSPYLLSGQAVTESIRHALEQSGISKLYVPERIAGPFARSYFEAARLVLESPDSSPEERARALRSSAGAVAQHLVHNPGINSFQMARDLTELTVAEAVKSPESLTALVRMTYVERELHSHLVNSSIYAIALSASLRISPPERIATIGLACLLYDLGLTQVRSSSAFAGDPDQDPMVRQHVFIGRDMIHGVSGLSREVREAALSHHERWDGTGYPAGLKGERIPLTARIAAVVDAFDLLTTSLPGVKPLTSFEALSVMSREMPGQFDQAILRALVAGLRA